MDGILLVDGYNVINNWAKLSVLKEKELAHARDQLVADLIEFRALCNIHVIVVFDAHFVKGGLGSTKGVQGVKVVYTKEGESADSWIERYAVKHHLATKKGEEVPLFVATYDWLEQRIVSAQGAYRITPGELLQDIQEIKDLEIKRLASIQDRVLLDHHLSEGTKKILEGWRREKTADA